MSNTLKIVLGLVVLVVVLFVLFRPSTSPSPLKGFSYEASQATSTDSTWNGQALVLQFKLLKTGPGTLDSILITNETAGALNLFDGTTTVNGAVYGTTTLMNVRASLAEGAYASGISFVRGLIAEFPTSNVASGTIIFR